MIIVGAGPVGSYCASLLAKKFDVSLYEEDSKIGEPVRCAGLVTNKINDFVKLKDEFVVNKIKYVKLFSRNKKFEFKLKDENFVLDRKKFDEYLTEQAVENGAKLFLKKRFLDYRNDYAIFNKGKVKTDILIGADGPLSRVAKSTNLFNNRDFYVAKQARVKEENDGESFEVYLDVPEFYAWKISESNKVMRVGIASKKRVNEYFKKFCKGKVIDYQIGLVPLYNPKIKFCRDNVYLIGDAASHVKATTGGGVVPGLNAANILARSLINNLDYEKETRELRRELYIHYRIRRFLNNFNYKDYDNLLTNLNENIGKLERDNAKIKLFQGLILNPRLILFLLKRTKYLYR